MQKSRSGRPEHAEWFAEDAVILDLVTNVPRLIFGVGRLVYRPAAVR